MSTPGLRDQVLPASPSRISENRLTFDRHDLKWIATVSTDLISILQQISRYSELAGRHQGERNYADLLGSRVELGSKTAQALFDRVNSRIRERSGTPDPKDTSPGEAPFVVLPAFTTTETAPSGNGAGTAKIRTSNEPKTELAVTASPSLPPDIKVINPQGERELILLIEDEREVADLAAEMLACEGYKVVVVHDGFEALKIYDRIGKEISLVILDFFMPIMDGDAVFEELRRLNPNIDVVLSSGFAEQHKISSMLADGLRGFIPKPYTIEKLLAQVRSTLDVARQPVQ